MKKAIKTLGEDLIAITEFMRRLDKFRTGVLLVVIASVSFWLGWHFFAFTIIAFPVLLAAICVQREWRWWRRLRRIARDTEPHRHCAPAQQTLEILGLKDDVIAHVLQQARIDPEVPIAELDQNNQVLSSVGSIPLFDDVMLDASAFRKRSRNRTRIVVVSDIVAVKKDYRDYESFRNEVIALHTLRHIDAVPHIVSVNSKTRTLYQSLIPGRNLGSMLAAGGASVSAQYLLGIHYPGCGGWTESSAIHPEREVVLDLLHEIVGDDFIASLEDVIHRIHDAGVALRDIKHGNVLVYNGLPHLCDFDFSRVYNKSSGAFAMLRKAELDKFKYLFGGPLRGGGVL